MSKIHYEKVSCPDCGYTGQYKVYDSINIDDESKTNPMFKRKIIDNSLFLYTCSRCLSKYYIEYPFLYNDVKNNFMVWCLPDNATQAEIDNIKKVDMRTYKGILRIVIGKFDFIDKLNVFENKLDDIAIESIKTFVFSKVDKEERREIKSIMFNGLNMENKTLEFVFIKDQEQTKMMSVPFEFYGQIKNMLKEKEIKGFEIIDQASYSAFVEND